MDERAVVLIGTESSLRLFVGVSGGDISSSSSSDWLKDTTRFSAGVLDDKASVDFPFIEDFDGEDAADRVFREDGVTTEVEVVFAAGYTF